MANKNHPKKETPTSCEGISERMKRQIGGEDIVSNTIRQETMKKNCEEIKKETEKKKHRNSGENGKR